MVPLSTQRLELQFNTHVWAHFNEELSSDVSDDIVADGGHGTLGGAKCMADTEKLTTWAVLSASLKDDLPVRASSS